MTLKPFIRPIFECRANVLRKLAINMCWRGFWGMKKISKQVKAGGKFVPAFAMISITDKCNYSCKGCWVSKLGRTLTIEKLNAIVDSFEVRGSHFFGLLGGEPLLHSGLLDLIESHKKSYFQIFTNGSKMTQEFVDKLAELGNATVLISLEGLAEESARRRGSADSYRAAMNAVKMCKDAGLFFGVATSVCKTNIDELVNFSHLQNLAKMGVHYLWYYIYRPVGVDANQSLALDSSDISRLRKFIVNARDSADLLIIDTYWDDKGRAICPAASGLSHHISPNGDLEFCPPLQVSDTKISEKIDVADAFKNSELLQNLRNFTAKRSRGCVLLESPSGLAKFLESQNFYDSSGRNSFVLELAKASQNAGHDMGENAICERNPIYKFLKKRYFFGFGAYG